MRRMPAKVFPFLRLAELEDQKKLNRVKSFKAKIPLVFHKPYSVLFYSLLE